MFSDDLEQKRLTIGIILRARWRVSRGRLCCYQSI